jgi:hypothetical protein
MDPDSPLTKLWTSLEPGSLPSFMEPRRAQIEAGLRKEDGIL